MPQQYSCCKIAYPAPEPVPKNLQKSQIYRPIKTTQIVKKRLALNLKSIRQPVKKQAYRLLLSASIGLPSS